MPSRSLLPLAVALAFVLVPVARAQDQSLPEIGSSAAELISPAEERAYGRQMLGEMREYEMLLEDPLIEAYLQGLGYRLASYSERPQQDFTFFLLRSREINAFATLGGHIGVNAGLILNAEREDEVAAVLAHEISHVTQRHVVRSVESAQKDTLPIALAMLGAVLAAEQAGDDGDGAQAAIAGGMALMQQRQINYTRSNEHEADRVGIHTLARAGMDPMAMADFFGRLQRANRAKGIEVPEYLRTHPVTTTRISEAKDRAEAARSEPVPAGAAPVAPLNPALPGQYYAALGDDSGSRDPIAFGWMRERLRVMSAPSPADVLAEYRRRQNATGMLTDAQRYGLALAAGQVGDTALAVETLDRLERDHRGHLWLGLARAEIEQRAGRYDAADARYAELLRNQPRNRAVVLSYATALAERGTVEAGRRAQEVLRPLLGDSLHDAAFQHAFARASESAGDIVRAGEAYAEAAYLNGRAEDALNQLQRLKDGGGLDYMQRARVDARIAAITPVVLELRARGIGPDGQRRRLDDAPQAGWSFSVEGS